MVRETRQRDGRGSPVCSRGVGAQQLLGEARHQQRRPAGGRHGTDGALAMVVTAATLRAPGGDRAATLFFPFRHLSLAYSRSPKNPTLQLLQKSSNSASTTHIGWFETLSELLQSGIFGRTAVQPFSQKSHTPTVAKEFQIGHYDPTESDLEHFWNSCSEGFLGERLYVLTFVCDKA